jgi:hypothetical protein
MRRAHLKDEVEERKALGVRVSNRRRITACKATSQLRGGAKIGFGEKIEGGRKFDDLVRSV